MVAIQSLLLRVHEAHPNRVRELVPEELTDAAGSLALEPATLIGHITHLFHGTQGTLAALLDVGIPLADLMTERERSFAAAAYEVPQGRLTNALFRENLRPLAEVFGESVVAAEPEPEVVLPDRAAADYPLFAHQRRAVRSVLRLLDEPDVRVLLHMPTGSGKTRCGMCLCCDVLRAREPSVVLWAASTGELLQQAALEAERAWSSLGNREISIGLGWGGGMDFARNVEDGFVIASLQSLWSLYGRDRESFKDLARRVSLMVFDETHQATAPTYQAVVDQIAADARLLGLSATPGRTAEGDTSADFELAQMFDRRRVTLDTTPEGYPNPVDYLVAEEYLAETTFEIVHVPPADGPGPSATTVNDGETTDSDLLPRGAYTLEVVNLVRSAMTDGHTRAMVFAASVRHAQHIAVLLSGLGLPARCVTGETPKPDRQAAIQWFKQKSGEPRIITNFGVLTTGFDAPDVTLSIIARPTKSLVLYSQMVGRAIRGPKANGTAEATVITVVDDDIPGFSDVAAAFVNWNELWKTTGETTR